MDTRFTDIRVLIWDFDKTLYKPNFELDHKVRESEYKVIMSSTGWDKNKTEEEFDKVYPSRFLSATEAVAHITQKTVAQTASEMEMLFDRTKYISRDEKLITLFKKLTTFEHYILMNGVEKKAEEALAVLGVRRDTFREIVTAGQVGRNKPNKEGYRYISEKTGVSPEHHLMIGDRILVDLVPAKELGMKTCWVHWNASLGEVQDSAIDVCIPSVYDVEEILV